MSFKKIPGAPRKWNDAELKNNVSWTVLARDLDVYIEVTGFKEAGTCSKSICSELLAMGAPYTSTCKMSDDQRLFRSSALLIAGHVVSCGGVPESDFVYNTLGGTSAFPGKNIKKELSIICNRLPAVRSAFCTKSTCGYAITVREYISQTLADVSIDRTSFSVNDIAGMKSQYHTVMVQKLARIVMELLDITKAAFGGKTSNNHVRHAVYFVMSYVMRNFDPSKQMHFKSRKIYDANIAVFSNVLSRYEESLLDCVTWMHSHLAPDKRSLLAMSICEVDARRALVHAQYDIEAEELENAIQDCNKEIDEILSEQREREQFENEWREEAMANINAAEQEPAVELPIPTCCAYTPTC